MPNSEAEQRMRTAVADLRLLMMVVLKRNSTFVDPQITRFDRLCETFLGGKNEGNYYGQFERPNSMSRKVPVPGNWIDYLRSQRESGMDYLVACVSLRDGRIFEQVAISGGYITMVRGQKEIPFSEVGTKKPGRSLDINSLIETGTKTRAGHGSVPNLVPITDSYRVSAAPH